MVIKKIIICSVATLSAILLFSLHAQALSSRGKIKASSLKEFGISVIPCPRYIAKPSTGLYTSINSDDVLCIGRIKRRAGINALKKYERTPFPFDGVLQGSTFLPIDQQEGDVNSDPFEEVNYPAAIHFNMTNASYSATYKFRVVDAVTDEIVIEALKGHVPSDGWVDWIGSGAYYFKTNALPDNEAEQPVFDVYMEFMEQYEGFPVSPADIQDANITTETCPQYFLDAYGGKLISSKDLICVSRGKLEDAGFTSAPYNFRTGLYLTRQASADILDGAGQGFPFRVRKPTPLVYSVDDPATVDNKKGSLNMYLVNISSGVKKPFVAVRGNIQATTTYINIPGDYYVKVEPHPLRPEKYGDITWEIYVEGAD